MQFQGCASKWAVGVWLGVLICFFAGRSEAADLKASAGKDRPRLLILTDIGGDPDDQQSMIRLLVHSDEYEIEGLIASASGTPKELREAITRPDLIQQKIDAYAQVWPNLRQHSSGFPSPDALREVVKSGNPHRGTDHVGKGHESEGSNWIITCIDRDDPRPLNIAIWGGQSDLAQALWQVKSQRSPEEYQAFLKRFRVYDIDDQDRIFDWMRTEFSLPQYVLAKSQPGEDKRQGIYRGMYLGGDMSLTSAEWVDNHVRTGHGPLGALYPTRTWTAPNPHGVLKEGDTPSWLYSFPNGLGDPAHPEWGSWGGRFIPIAEGIYRDVPKGSADEDDPRASVWKWRPDFQNEFAARMDWCVKPVQEANHPPLAVLNGVSGRGPVRMTAQRGGRVELSSAGSEDPDGDVLTTSWTIDADAGTFQGQPRLSADQGESVVLTIPDQGQAGAIHVILTVRDSGAPPLTRYRRAIVDVQ